MLNQLLNNPFLYSLSLTLLHFLWQGLLVGLALKSALLIIDKKKSKLRYGISTLAMLSNAILAIFTFIIIYSDAGTGINANLPTIPLTSLVSELTQQATMLSYQELVPSILAYSLPYVSLLWLATIAILAGKLLIEVRNVNNLSKSACVPPTEALLARFEELANQINLSKTPTFLISLKAEVPMAIGWLKPVVLLPASMVTGLNSEQLEMLILHELAHIRRHDYLVNFFQTMIELVLFFHPSVHWIGKQMRNEREYCSDDIAVQHSGDPIAYARTLTDTASLCVNKCTKKHFHTIPTMAMAASGGDLKGRVLRLVDHHCAPSNDSNKWFVAIITLLALIMFSVNQLLTMSLTSSINSQFSWQESNEVIADSLISTPKVNKKISLSTDSSFSLVTENSIASQLLNQKSRNNQFILLGSLAPNSENNSKTRNDKVSLSSTSTLANSHKINTVSDTVTDTVSKIDVLKPSITREEVAISDLTSQTTLNSTVTKADNTLLAESLTKSRMSSVNNVSLLTNNQPTPTKVTLNLASQANTSLSIKTQPNFTYTQNSNTLLQVSNIQDKQLTSQAASGIDQLASVSLVPNQTLHKAKAKNTSYAKIAYSQEINDLASKGTLYKASHPLNAKLDTDKKNIIARTSHKAKLLDSISPKYPLKAKRRGIEMEVKVNFTIDRNGKVKDINFDQQNKITYFKSSVRSAISKWRFTPAKKNNDIVESKMSKIFSFSLQS